MLYTTFCTYRGPVLHNTMKSAQNNGNQTQHKKQHNTMETSHSTSKLAQHNKMQLNEISTTQWKPVKKHWN